MAIEYADELQGPSIYQLENKTIYYNQFQKKAYILQDKNVKEFTRLQRRLPMSIIVTAVGLILFQLTWESLIMGVALYAIIAGNFYTSFLRKLNKFEGFTPEKYFDYRAYTPNVTRKILIWMLLVSFVIIFIEYNLVK